VEQRLQHADKWFILSAKHGLLSPDDVIEPYEKTLNRMRVTERQSWAKQVLGSLTSPIKQADRVVILAGMRYRELLHEELLAMCRQIEVPMEGLRIGKQLQWLEQELHNNG